MFPEVLLVAKSMAEEIFGAERQAEKILSDAESNALLLEDRAKEKAVKEKKRITNEAHSFADELLKKAYGDAEAMKSSAEKESEKDTDALKQAFEKNLNAAAQAAIEIIAK